MTPEEARVIAWTILGEGANQGSIGMTAIAHVIRNRSLSGRYPSNPAAVATQGGRNGYYQFSTWNPLDKGGNAPRARYPVGGTSMQQALGIVNKVFGVTPGTDPTQGATHYYSPKGMPGGQAPYWWRSEVTLGEKKIGDHVFAIRYSPKEAPVPASRAVSITSDLGYYPSTGELEVFRTGERIKLPTLAAPGSTKVAPVPATPSLKLQVQRENAGAQVKNVTTLIYDPVTQALKPKSPSASDLVRAAGAAKAAQAPARSVVAGFSVPQGVDGIKQVEAARVTASDRVRAAGAAKAAGGTQTVYGPNQNIKKDQSRLPEGEIKVGEPPEGAQAGNIQVVPAPKVAPTPMPPIQRPPVPVAAPRPEPLKITVQRDPVVKVIQMTPVDMLRSVGFSPADSYDLANTLASVRAASGGKYSGDDSRFTGSSDRSPGSRTYNRDTNQWE